jgi:DNA-binding MarR family transcriptional regulator
MRASTPCGFNRFYTNKSASARGPVRANIPYRVRVLYEPHTGNNRAADLIRELGLDAGYLSRILRGFAKRGLITKTPSTTDRRQTLLSLTARGRRAFAPLNARSHDEVAAVLTGLSAARQARLIEAMGTIQTVLGAHPEPKVPYVLRPHQPGDMGWIIHRHGVLYAREYGWDEAFEALVAEIAAKFIRNFDPKRERCWIAEREGGIVGSVFWSGKPKRWHNCA